MTAGQKYWAELRSFICWDVIPISSTFRWGAQGGIRQRIWSSIYSSFMLEICLAVWDVIVFINQLMHYEL